MRNLLFLPFIILICACVENEGHDTLDHSKAVYIKKGWIRDPYVYLYDGTYYLTGTTASHGDPREQTEPYNTGLDWSNQQLYGTPSIVGHDLNIWKSNDLLNWEYLGAPFNLEAGFWKKGFPHHFDTVPPTSWRLWAPEIYHINGKWVYLHTSPSPIKGGANLAITNTNSSTGSFQFPMGEDMRFKHDPSLFQDEDGTWYLLWGNTKIAPILPGFQGLASDPVRIDPLDRKIGHEGATLRKIGQKYVHFGTAWSTDQLRKGSYNLYYCTSDNILGPYGKRRFVGRFLGHGTPFQDKTGRWWCTAFFNGDVPPVSDKDITTRDLRETAQTINEQGVTIVPLEVRILEDGDVYVRAKDPRYGNPGPDESDNF